MTLPLGTLWISVTAQTNCVSLFSFCSCSVISTPTSVSGLTQSPEGYGVEVGDGVTDSDL